MVAQGGVDPPYRRYEQRALAGGSALLAAGDGIKPPQRDSKSRVLSLNEPAMVQHGGFEPPFPCLKGKCPSLDECCVLVRTPGAAPGTSGWKPDTLLLRYVRAEGRRHDHHTLAGAASLAGSAGASPVDLP